MIESLRHTGAGKDSIPEITYAQSGSIDTIRFGKDILVNVANSNYPDNVSPGRTVDLVNAANPVDRALALRQMEDSDTYNCHYYSYMRSWKESDSLHSLSFDNVIAGLKGFPDIIRQGYSGAGVQLNDETLKSMGFRSADRRSSAKPGDIAAVENELEVAGARFKIPGQLAYLHSGVIDRIENGAPLVREKLGPGKPVVDQTFEAFSKTWSGSAGPGEKVHLWNRADK